MLSKIKKKLPRSFNRKTFIIFALIILILVQYTFITHHKTSPSIVNSTPLQNINDKQCYLSMIESDGWFCESDSDWKRRKAIDHIQNKRNHISDRRDLFFQNNWEPTIRCEFERRIGNPGDGGKWICDIHRFLEINNTNLLIYSFGCNDEFSFERVIKEELPEAEIHTFDRGVFQCPDNVCTFHQARIGNGENGHSKSLQMIMNELGHQKREIHILKVDIEGSEFDLFEELFNPSTKTQTNVPYIRQILFEIHLNIDRINDPVASTHKLFELFRRNNYAIFHKEVNLSDPRNVFEYALLRLNSAFF